MGFYYDNRCFACGKLNEAGLQLSFTVRKGECESEFLLPERFYGFVGVAHGGIVSAILDEAMWYANFLSSRNYVTASLKVSFLKPVKVGEWLSVRARVVWEKKRLWGGEAEIVDGEGRTLAKGEGVYYFVAPV